MDRPALARPASAAFRVATSSRPLVLPRAAVGRGAVGRAALGSAATGALAVGAVAAGALAVGALAIGALSVGRLAVRRAAAEAVRLGRVEIDELVVHSYLGPGAATSPQPGEPGPATRG